MNVIALSLSSLSACKPAQNAFKSILVASDMLLGERRGRSAMNVKATWSFSADWHVLSFAVIQEGSVG